MYQQMQRIISDAIETLLVIVHLLAYGIGVAAILILISLMVVLITA